MSGSKIERIIDEIDAIHRELARVSIGQLLGTPSALTTSDVLESHPLPLKKETIDFLKESVGSARSRAEVLRTERILFGCMDLAVESEIASLSDMLSFYVQRGRMHVGSEKIPALEVVPWLQAQPDFGKREQMRKENSIFLKAIVNPILTGILELTIRATQRFGFDDFACYSEAKKQVCFEDQANLFAKYLEDTARLYLQRVVPWVEEEIGCKFESLSRYHALYLLRIRRFDDYFPRSALRDIVRKTFSSLGFDPWTRPDVTTDLSDEPVKNPNGLCVGVEIPGEVHVLMRPVGGLIDVETLLHEMGHAFFLSHFDPDLPIEYRRLYRSPALDEAFAFLFMDLIDNPSWATMAAGMSSSDADKLAELNRTKRLCLIRRYIAKFLAELELHKMGNIKDSQPYCRHLKNATGFVYEPEGYLIDMEPNFYALDYLRAWGGANVLRSRIEDQYGEGWFTSHQAGDFLKQIAALGRRDSLDDVLLSFCGEPPRLPVFPKG